MFNDETVRVISDRQKKYSDKRANPAGKMPDDVWNEYPRVCGTFTRADGLSVPDAGEPAGEDHPRQLERGRLGARSLLRLRHHRRRRPQAQPHVHDASTSPRQYVQAARERIAESEGLPVEGKGSPDWPEHADAELQVALQREQNPGPAALCRIASLLSLFTKKLNGRLQKKQPYTIKEVNDRLNLLGSKLSPLDKASAARMEASSLEE